MGIASGLFNQSITSINSVANNSYGDTVRTVVYSDVPCRWVESINKTVTVEAIEKKYKVECWMGSDYTITESYEIIFDSEIYHIVAIAELRDLAGNIDHHKLYLT